MDKIEYIKKLENTDLIFSVLRSSDWLNSIVKLEKNSNLKLVYTESEYERGKIVYDSKLFKSDTGFFILAKRLKLEIPKYELTIYHLPAQLNEIVIFLNFLNK